MDSLDRNDAPAAPDQDATVYIAFELKLGIVVSGAAKLSRYTVARSHSSRTEPCRSPKSRSKMIFLHC
jgi:hypothetical protein